MTARGLNQTMLAKKSGVERSVINRVISGKARPRFEQLEWIAKVLGVDAYELMRTAELSSDLRLLFDQLCAARERIRELECERDDALAQVRRLDSKPRRRTPSSSPVMTRAT
jgi:transcriptional regulator with XRE-family HTH domain